MPLSFEYWAIFERDHTLRSGSLGYNVIVFLLSYDMLCKVQMDVVDVSSKAVSFCFVWHGNA